jgi:hypothetical protein
LTPVLLAVLAAAVALLVAFGIGVTVGRQRERRAMGRR